jgi:NTE family protein
MEAYMKALVLSGGGNKGSWQSGCTKYLLGDLEIKYDILCGVSAGAINASFLSQYSHGYEKDAGNKLYELWLQLDTPKIYKRHFPWGRWHALFKPSFYDSSPLNELIKSNIKLEKIRNSNKKVAVGAVSLSTGKYTIFDQNSNYFIDAVIASASFPGMLSPVKFDGQLWADGGSKELSPLKTAIDLGADEIDVIITSPQTRIKKFIENPTTVDVLRRVIDLSTDKIMANDLEKVEMYNKLAQAGLIDKKYVKINVLRPDFNLTEDLLDFDPVKLKQMAEKGYQDAKSKYICNISA